MPNEDTNTVYLIVKSADQDEVHFKIKRDVPLKKLIDKYCARIGVNNPNSVNFLYEDKKITPSSTPERLKMQDGDAIHVVVPQVGG